MLRNATRVQSSQFESCKVSDQTSDRVEVDARS